MLRSLTCLNRSAGGRTLPLKGFLIWSSREGVLCTLEHLRRRSWGKEGYRSFSSGTQRLLQYSQRNLSHHILLESTGKSCSRVLGHCHAYINPSGNGRGQAQGGWPSCSVLPSSPHSNRTEGLQGPFLSPARAETLLARAMCVLLLSSTWQQAPWLSQGSRVNFTRKPTVICAYFKIYFVQLHIPDSLV